MNKLYSTNDLQFAQFTYSYEFNYYDSIGENYVLVEGQRNGIITQTNAHYIDLISGLTISEENIIQSTPFKTKDEILPLSSIENIFKNIEENNGYQAYEITKKRSHKLGTLYSCIPYDTVFKPSQSKQGIIDEFVKNAKKLEENPPCNCEIDKLRETIKSKIKRKK